MRQIRRKPQARRLGRKTFVAAVGLALAGRAAVRRVRRDDLHGEVALITGGSRGLGFLLARELTRQGCRLALCARDLAELEAAKRELEREGGDVFIAVCDVAGKEQVERLVEQVNQHFGRVDILVNNAGIIQVGPLRTMNHADFEQALGIMFWGVINPTLALLPQMLDRRSGRIVNITSIGGEVSVPRLLPYGAAKHAAVGFSEGLHAELSGSGIAVTTVVPGLMRTGSHLNALFKGRLNREFTWMSLAASLPAVSMDAERAAGQIVNTLRDRRAYVVLSIPATILSRVQGLFPGATADLLAGANRFLLPPDDGAGERMARGMEIEAEHPSRLRDAVTGLGRSAARRFHEYPGPVNGAVPPRVSSPP